MVLHSKQKTLHMYPDHRERSLIQLAVLQAVCYADIFHFVLKQQEIHRYLITTKQYSRKQTFAAITSLETLTVRTGLVCLRGREALFLRRKKAEKISQEKMKLTRKAAVFFSRFPTVLAVFVTGSVAVGNARTYDDLDFLIVTKTGWLWTTRFFVVLISKLLRKYRKKNSHNRAKLENTWCLNIWLDASSLQIPANLQNLYTAHEVVQAVCVFDRLNIEQQFLLQNGWIQRYLRNMGEKELLVTTKASKKTSANPFRYIEFLFFLFQTLYMCRSKTTETVTKHFAYFHPVNLSEMIQKKLKARVAQFVSRD